MLLGYLCTLNILGGGAEGADRREICMHLRNCARERPRCITIFSQTAYFISLYDSCYANYMSVNNVSLNNFIIKQFVSVFLVQEVS